MEPQVTVETETKPQTSIWLRFAPGESEKQLITDTPEQILAVASRVARANGDQTTAERLHQKSKQVNATSIKEALDRLHYQLSCFQNNTQDQIGSLRDEAVRLRSIQQQRLPGLPVATALARRRAAELAEDRLEDWLGMEITTGLAQSQISARVLAGK